MTREPRTVRYGDDPSQFAELLVPSGTPKGVVVVIPDEGPVAPALAYIHSLGQKLACLLPLTTARHKLGGANKGQR